MRSRACSREISKSRYSRKCRSSGRLSERHSWTSTSKKLAKYRSENLGSSLTFGAWTFLNGNLRSVSTTLTWMEMVSFHTKISRDQSVLRCSQQRVSTSDRTNPNSAKLALSTTPSASNPPRTINTSVRFTRRCTKMSPSSYSRECLNR